MQRAKTMTAGLARAALIGVIAGCLGAPGLVLGQPAPPPAKPKSPPAAAAAPKPPAAATVPPVATNPFAALLGRPSDKLDPMQRAIIDKVNAYLTNTQMLSGKFVQVAPDGRRSQGQFFMSKPGKVRFEYDAPSPMDIVADGDSVVVRDR